MKVVTLASVGTAALIASWASVTEAAPRAAMPVSAYTHQSLIVQVDSSGQRPSQREGIVNERSTGNEPFMGPGASGGPTHSAPGATENTIKQSQDKKQGMSRSEGGATAGSQQSGSKEQHAGSGQSSSSGH